MLFGAERLRTHPVAARGLVMMDSTGVEPRSPVSAQPGVAGPNASLIGRMVGPYRIVARLGGGAMAAVYRAVDTRAGTVRAEEARTGDPRSVALKVLLPDADATVRERFRLEARMGRALDHPHIVRTLDVSDGGSFGAQGAHDELTCIAMEMVEGEHMGDLLDRERALNGVDSCALLAPIAHALAYAHARGVVHRDVKPSNILLRRAEPGAPGSVRISVLDTPVVPLLSDFGIAHALDAPELTSAGRTIGTPAYMSPEQCAGDREIDGRADLYSLGAVLYRALAGRAPYTGSTTQILYSHVYDPLTVPDELLRTLSPLLIDLLRLSLAKEPQARYATAGAMAAALEAGAGRAPAIGKTASAEAATPEQFTQTMPDLATTRPGSTTSTVIVPAPVPVIASRSVPAPAANPVPAATSAMAPRPIVPAPAWQPRPVEPLPVQAPARARPLRGRGMLIGLLIVIPLGLLLGLATAALLDAMPWRGRDAAPTSVAVNLTPDATTPVAVAGDTDAAKPVSVAPVEAPGATSPGTPSAEATGAPPTESATPEVTATPTFVPTAQPTPSGDIALYWEDAQSSYADRDWMTALSWLTLVQRIDPDFEAERIAEMAFGIAMQMAAAATEAGDFEAARTQLARAVELNPTSSDARSLLQATERLIDVLPGGAPGAVEAAQRELQVAHASYGAALVTRSLFCDAADQLDAALTLVENAQQASYTADVREQCIVLMEAQADQETLTSLAGRLLYSTQIAASAYRIYLVDAEPGARSQVVVEDGRQPAMAVDERTMAFHSTRGDSPGISGFDLEAGLAPAERSTLYTRSAADAADSPPSWNLQGSSLVFAAIDSSDRRSHIRAVQADGRDLPQDLGQGQTPAWSWANDLIAFNGVDTEGQNPGLWLMQPDGSGQLRLTDNGADIRPAWSPDGATVVFMSSGRSGNWDVYRATLPDGELTQITDDPAQDGIPTVSPDGKFIAYVSDRGGAWNIWVAPIEGGKSLLLAPVEGTLTNWLEHNLQWIP